MKKLISIVLTLAMLLTTLVMLVPASPVSAAVTTAGDLNNDGVVNSIDSLLLKKYVTSIQAHSINTAAADLDGDGKINSRDIVLIKMYLACVIDSFSASPVSRAVSELLIAGNDISTYDIVVADPQEGFYAYENYHYASRQLRNFIKAAMGYELNITYTPYAQHHIYLVHDASGAHGKEAYTWRIDEKGDFYMIGGYQRGNMYAVMDFAKEYLGMRVWEYGCDDFLPQGKVSVPAGLDYTYDPQFTYRCVNTLRWSCGTWDEDAAFLFVSNKVNSHTNNVMLLNPKYGYGDGNVWVNAHSFEYIFGISAAQQPCLAPSNWTNHQIAINWCCDLVRDRATWENNSYIVGVTMTRLSVSWNDNENYCWCSECKAIYQEEKSVAGTIVRFNNIVSENVRAIWPEMEIYFIAYGSARIPPVVTKPNKGLVVAYCWNGCNNHTYGSDDCSDYGNTMGFTNWEERYYFEYWCEIADRIFLWYYAYNFYYFIAPCPNILNIREDFRYLAEHGVDGIYYEGNYGGANRALTFEPIRDYLAAQCMWNPYMSEGEFDQTLNEFLEYAYGEGWEYIKEYLYMADEAGNQAGCFTNNYDWPGNLYSLSYMYEHFEEMDQLFINARAESDSVYYDRINKMSIPMYFLAVCGAFEANGGSIANDPESMQRYDYVYGLMQQYNFTPGMYVTSLGSKSYNESPLLSWFGLEVLSGRWEDWYAGPGQRPNPCDDPKHSVNLNRYITSDLNRYENPYADLMN